MLIIEWSCTRLTIDWDDLSDIDFETKLLMHLIGISLYMNYRMGKITMHSPNEVMG